MLLPTVVGACALLSFPLHVLDGKSDDIRLAGGGEWWWVVVSGGEWWCVGDRTCGTSVGRIEADDVVHHVPVIDARATHVNYR